MARISPGVLVGVSLWRLLIVGVAFVGFWEYASLDIRNLAYLTQQAAFATGAVYLVLLVYPLFADGQRHEPPTRWARGAIVVLLLLVSGTYATMMAGTYHDLGGLLSHLATPLLVLMDWLGVGRSQGRCRWWHPISWLALPVAYLAFYLWYGEVLYGFLDPGSPLFVTMAAQFLAVLLAAGYVLYGLAKLKAALSRALREESGPPAPSRPSGLPEHTLRHL